MAYDKSQIWRTYYKKRMNILGGAKNIHDAIFGSGKENISKYGQAEAELLTDFFRQYKKVATAAKRQDITIGDQIFLQLGQTTIRLPALNFALGGNASNLETAQGGNLFEKEIQNLLNKSFDKEKDSSAGTDTATSILKLGSTNLKTKPEDFLKEIAGKRAAEIINQIGISFVELLNEEEKGTKNVYLKTSGRRAGKTDAAGTGDKNDINITLETEDLSGGKLDKVLDVLSKANFSIKSYTSDNTIELGSTNDYKAVSAIGEWVGTDWSRGAALYYLHHPIKGEDKRISTYQEDSRDELYKHYDHMKKVFELTGLGLTYKDMSNLNVDFLLVNRARGEDIICYSVKDLISSMKNGTRYSFSEVANKYSAIDW